MLSQSLAGFSKGEADTLRKAMGKKSFDLLAKMKSDAWWSKVKKTAADKGLTLTFDVIKTLALPAAKGLLGLDQD